MGMKLCVHVGPTYFLKTLLPKIPIALLLDTALNLCRDFQ